MFDIGMGEIALTAVIALLVLGPERLPGAARTAGKILRKARNSWQSVRSEIERELAAEEIKHSIKQTTEAVGSLNPGETSLNKPTHSPNESSGINTGSAVAGPDERH